MTEFDGNKIAVAMSPGVEFIIPTPNSGPLGIAYAFGDEFWFTESRTNRIGRVRFDPRHNTAVFLSEITIPTPASTPQGIATDVFNLGNAWFTEFTGNKIGRAVYDVTTSLASVTDEFLIPTLSAGPTGIAINSRGGRVWFTEFFGNKIGSLDPSTGTFAEYPIPTANSGPLEIVQSGDDFWFTESLAGKIGRIRQDGSITEYPLPNGASAPSGITADYSGGVWFTERASGRIGRATPDGSIKEFSLPSENSGPSGILAFTPSPAPELDPLVPGGSKLVIAESLANRVAVAEADSLVVVGAGSAGQWYTDFEISNPANYPVTVITTTNGTTPETCIIVLHTRVCPPSRLLPPHGTATFADTLGIRFSTTYWIPVGFDLPTVKARVVNRENSTQTVDLPVLRYSSIANLGLLPLSFPFATKKSAGGARSNLVIADVSRQGPDVSPLGPVAIKVELFSSAGELLASAPFYLPNGGPTSTLFIQDVVGSLGIPTLEGGNVLITNTSNSGLLWGVMITAREDGTLISSLGRNP